MWGGSLTRYQPPPLPPQDGRGLREDLYRLGGPILASAVQVGARAGARAVVARGGTGGRPRDTKRIETQGSPHCCHGRQEIGRLDSEERVSEHGRTHSRRAGRVRDDASTTVGGTIPASLSTERALAVWTTTRRMARSWLSQTASLRLDQMVVGPTTSRSAWRMARSWLSQTARVRLDPMVVVQEAYKTATPLRWRRTRRPQSSWVV